MDRLLDPAAAHGGEPVAYLLTFLGPADLAAVAGTCLVLRAYARSDLHWRYHTLREYGADGLAYGDELATSSWWAAYVHARCTAGGWPPERTRSCLAAGAAADALLAAAPVASPWLFALHRRSTLRVGGLEPVHVTAPMRAAVRDGGAVLDVTWAATAGDAVPVVASADLPPARFAAEFEAPGRAVVVRGALGGWPAAATDGTGWSLDSLAAAVGHTTRVSLAHRAGAPYGSDLSLSAPLPAYLAYMRSRLAAVDELPLYVFDSDYGETAPGLLRGYDVPSLGGGLFPEDLLAGMGRAARPVYRWLVVGGPRSGTPWHWDPHGTSAWNALLVGTKRWFLYPPGWDVPGVTVTARDAGGRPTSFRSPLSPSQWLAEVYPALPHEQRPVEFVQRAGDVVFVPSRCWHMVVNLEETLSVTQNYVATGLAGRRAGADAWGGDDGGYAPAGGSAPAAAGSAVAADDNTLPPLPPLAAPGPAAPLSGNLLEVAQDIALIKRSLSGSDGGGGDSEGGGGAGDYGAAAAAPDDVATGGTKSPALPAAVAGDDAAAVDAAGVGDEEEGDNPDPDAHGLTFAPPHLPAEAVEDVHPAVALKAVALAAAQAAVTAAAEEAAAAASDDGAAARRRQDDAEEYARLLGDSLTLAEWYRREGGALQADRVAAASDGTAAPRFPSHAALLASCGDAALFAGVISRALGGVAVPAASLRPLTSRVNPTFAVAAPAPGTAAASSDSDSVVKLFSPFVCEDGGRPFQPAAAVASWRAEVAVLRHWDTLPGSLRGDLQLPRLLGAGNARPLTTPLYDCFSPPLLRLSPSPTSAGDAASAPAPRVSWEIATTVQSSESQAWTWPYARTELLGAGATGDLTTLAAAREQALAPAGAVPNAAAAATAWHTAMATALATLVAALHHSSGGYGEGGGIAAQLTRLRLSSGAGDGSPSGPLDLRQPVAVPYPGAAYYRRTDGGAPSSPGAPAATSAPGVLLPLGWAPYFCRLLALRQTAAGRRGATRRAPLHLVAEVDAFLPPLAQTHVLLPLGTHPAYLPVDAATGYVDLTAPGVLPPPALLHGDLTAENVFGAWEGDSSGAGAGVVAATPVSVPAPATPPPPAAWCGCLPSQSAATRPPVVAPAAAPATTAARPRRWRPTHLIDLADAAVGDPLWDAVAAWCAALGGDTSALGAFLAAYDDAVAASSAIAAAGGAQPLPRLCADPSLGYRLTCLLLLHPVDGTGLAVVPWLSNSEPATDASEQATNAPAAGAADKAAGAGTTTSPADRGPVLLARGEVGPLSWAEVAARIVTDAQSAAAALAAAPALPVVKTA